MEWFSCAFSYPICVIDKDGNTLASLPCASELQKLKKKSLIKAIFVDNYANISRICPQYATKQLDYLFSGSNLQERDIHHMEKCQQYVPPSTRRNNITQTNCYLDQGIDYNGTLSVGSNKKSCIPWKEVPGLNSSIYEELKENYCRNPQGYGESPWCYTNMERREVSYCSLTRCGEKDAHKKKPTLLYVTLLLSLVVRISLLVGCRTR